MDIFSKREIYKPFEYPEFEEIHTKLMSSFWMPHEVSLDSDIKDFNMNITKDEKELITRILRNFVQSEVHVGSFWSDVADLIKKPEIQNVCRYMAGQETTHTFAYDYLNASLGLEEYHLLKEDKKLYARVDNLINKKAKSKDQALKHFALYSVFGEGVALFSSFIILFAFTKKNVLKNLGQIISWSTLDEALHSEVGCRLFNLIKKEFPDLLQEELQEEIKKVADKIVQIELDLIDRCFEGISVDVISPEDVKNYINDRANKQLKKIGFKKRYKVNKERLKNTEFFDIMINGESVNDFFANRETSYSKGLIVFDESVWK